MPASYKILGPKDIDNPLDEKKSFALDILLSLSQTPKKLSSKYFYDTEGSKLFTAITELPEYYLTKCEFEILDKYKHELANLVSSNSFNLIELGPGDGKKTNLLLNCFIEKKFDFSYVPIDISESSMQTLIVSMQKSFPSINVNGIVSEYFDGIKWLQKTSHDKKRSEEHTSELQSQR